MGYLQSGVDISKGTAMYVLNHKAEQGQEMINDTAENLAISIRNTKKINTAQANLNLLSGLANTALTAVNSYTMYDLQKQQQSLFGGKTPNKTSQKYILTKKNK